MKPHSTKIFRDMINGIGAFIQSQFMNPPGGPAAQGKPSQAKPSQKYMSEKKVECRQSQF